MKNKDKYDLSELYFMWQYNPYYDVCGASIVYENKHIADISLEMDNPIQAIMNWLESECEEND